MRDLLLTTAEAAQLFDVPVGTLRRWAHEDQWTPHGSTRHRQWLHSQIQGSYDQRRGVAT